MSTEEEFADMVAGLSKEGQVIKDAMTAEEAHLLHMAIGLAGEVGELLDAIKKHVIYKKPLDMENVKEELGDMEFYAEGLRAPLGLLRDDIIAYNIKKLGTRYSSGTYSNTQAQDRADKK